MFDMRLLQGCKAACIITLETPPAACSAIAITIKMSDKVSEVSKDSFAALAGAGQGEPCGCWQELATDSSRGYMGSFLTV